MSNCPLCSSKEHKHFASDKTRDYEQCQNCFLVFVESKFYLDAKAEKKRYDLHTNSSEDEGYKNYLKKVSTPVIKRLFSKAKGLDFGSGPGPTLSLLFEEAGFGMKIYDHFYAKDETVLESQYDFITSTEVIEHLYAPEIVIDKLWSLLNDKGLLCLLTQLYPSTDTFEKWYYKNDPTHVCFFSLETMNYLALKYKAQLEIIDKDIFIFTKNIPYK